MAGQDSRQNEGQTPLDYFMDFAPEAALITGLTREQQDDIIKQFATNVIERRNEDSKIRHYNDEIDSDELKNILMSSAKDRDKLVDAIHFMPEEFQDSWLLAVHDASYPEVSYGARRSHYNPSSNRVTIKEYDPYTVIHEYTHAANQNMNRYNPYYRGFYNFQIPDRMAEINLGKTIDDEAIRDIRTKSVEHIAKGESEPIERMIRDFVGIGLDDDGRKNAQEAVSDMLTMNPHSKFGKQFLFGHDEDYKNEQITSNKSSIPKSNKYAPYYAPMSIEGSADIGEILATPSGENWLKKKMPETYARMMEEYKNDPRKVSLKNGDGRYVLPWLWTNNENTVPYKYVPKGDRMYFRYQSPYGGYVDGDNPLNAERMATKEGHEYFEYKGLNGDWKRQYTNAVRHGKNPGDKRTFDNSFRYYVQTPGGRKGLVDLPDLIMYMAANPDRREIFEMKPVYDENGKLVVDENGAAVRQWQKSEDGYMESAAKTMGEDSYFKPRVDRYRRERTLMDKIHMDKIKEAEKALAKKAIQAIRTVR